MKFVIADLSITYLTFIDSIVGMACSKLVKAKRTLVFDQETFQKANEYLHNGHSDRQIAVNCA